MGQMRCVRQKWTQGLEITSLDLFPLSIWYGAKCLMMEHRMILVVTLGEYQYYTVTSW